jgi:hypothetical protein
VNGRRPPIAISVDLAAFEELRARLALLECQRADALARVVAIREALEYGDPGYAAELARSLEHDLGAGR